MKITRIELYSAELPYSGGVYTLSGGRTYESFDSSIIRIVCDNGVDGWGESTPFGSTYIAAHPSGVRAGVGELAPALLGHDPRRTGRIADSMDSALTGHNHAKTPLDVACWDAFGKSVGLPVCELLGGSFDVPMPMISSIPAGDPERCVTESPNIGREAIGGIPSRSEPLTLKADPRSTPNASRHA